MQSPHNLDIQGLQRVAGRLDEVHASVDPVVDNIRAVDFILRIQISIKALLDVIDNWAPRLVVIDEITETGGVYDSET